MKRDHSTIVSNAVNEKSKHQNYVDQFIVPVTIDEGLWANITNTIERSIVFGKIPKFT